MKLYASTALPPTSEKDWQRQVVDVAKLLGWSVYHPMLSKWSERGWPDLSMVRPPRLIFAELKRVGARTTPDQGRWLGMLSSCPGCEVYFWRPVDLEAVAAVLR